MFNFRLVWPVDAASLGRYIKDEFDCEIDFRNEHFGGKALVIVNGKHKTYLVALTGWRGNADDHAKLAHECLHTANNVLEDRGVSASWEHDEPQAYLTAYLVRECLNVLMPKSKRVFVEDSVKPRKRKK